MARILVGISGGIAAYKSVELVRLAIRAGHSVRVVATASAERFVGAATFEGITGAPVLISELDPDPMRGSFPGDPAGDHLPIGHLAIAERAEAMIVAPASANTLAKLACGICDSALTTAFLAHEGPRLVAPAMNDRMYADRATADNVERLRERGVEVIEPEKGDLASRGEHGLGRLVEPGRLLEAVEDALAGRALSGALDTSWQGRRVLVTAGGTRESLDPVRYVGNRSSGRMGVALAEEARDRGAEVTLIAANLAVPPPGGVEVTEVVSTAELAEACRAELAAHDVLIMAAAPADFAPERVSDRKLRREGGELTVRMVPTPDILAELSEHRRPGQVLVGFAAEDGGDGPAAGREKLSRKGADMIVVNDVSDSSIGFDSERNAVTIVTAEDERRVGPLSKREVAAAILDGIDEGG